jgi:hypothetical protein
MSDNKKPPVLEVVKGATAPKASGKKPPATTGGGNGGGSGVHDQEIGDYFIRSNAFWQKRPSRDGGFIEIKLCDFVAEVVEEISADDGLSESNFLRIRGWRFNGADLPVIDVPIKSFVSPQSTWANEHWGMRVFICPGAAKQANIRAAIQLFSTQKGEILRRRIYRYTGWKKIDDAWHYLHGAGAIAGAGLVDGVQVDLGAGHMSRYQLTAPLSGDELKQAVADALLLLDVAPKRPHIGAALLAAVARAPLGECHPTDFAIWLHGLTGSRKSAIAAIAQAFFGNFTARSFPANWSDTINDAEMKAHQAKDGVFVVDDFKPSVNRVESEKLHAMAERLIRGTGNQSGRGRRSATMQAQAAPFNRSMMIVTAEDLPRGVSLLGRLLVLELSRDDVDNPVLTQLQAITHTGRFVGLMSAYLQWLAPRLDQLKSDFPKLVEQFRNAAIRDGFASSHPRASEIYANLLAGVETFLEFLESAGALDSQQSGVLLGTIESNLQQAFREQGSYLTEQDEVERFLSLLRAALSSGNGHIANRLDQQQPKTRPYSWGWRDAGIDLAGEKTFKPMGDCLGWYYDGGANEANEVWLEPESCFSAVQKFARSQGEGFLLSAGSLWRCMLERGLLLKTETNGKDRKPRTSVKRLVANVNKRVLVVSAELIESG